MRIKISLPENRDYAGHLEVLDSGGTVIFGPVPAAGRAHDELATAHGNASRSPLRPYGDTPLGSYTVGGIIESGTGTGLEAESFGSQGVVLLEPGSGPCAFADAHGRLRLFIQGGGDHDVLRVTAGAVRLRDRDQRQLVALMRRESGRVLCEVVSTAEHGAALSLTPIPLDRDPPAQRRGRSYFATRSPATLSRGLTPSSGARTSGFAPRMFVMTERSGSGATTVYGPGSGVGDGAGAGDGSESGMIQIGISATYDPDTGVATINTMPDTGVDVAPTPGADLNPPPDQTATTLSQSGSDQLLSNSDATGLSSPYQPQPYNPYTAAPAGTPTLTPYAPQRDSINDPDAAIQEMVTRFAQYDAQLNAQADPNSPWAAAIPPSLLGNQPYTGAGQSSANPPSNTTSPPPRASSPPPPRVESSGAWSRGNPSQAAEAGIQQAIDMGFLRPDLLDSNVATATASTEGSINRLILGQTGENTAYDARLAQGEIGILAPKGVSLRGLDYLTASQLPNGDYNINVGDTASRYTDNPFKVSPGAARPDWQQTINEVFGPPIPDRPWAGSFSLDDPIAEQGVRDAFAAGRISNVQIDTVDFSPNGQGALTVNGTSISRGDPTPSLNTSSLDTPALDTPVEGGGGFGTSAAGGAGLGAGVSTLINAGQILLDPDAHPDAARELTTTAFLGGAGGATGAAINSAVAPELGATVGGGVAGGPAAALVTLGSMALDDNDYTAEDYEAKGLRSAAAGTFSGALAAGGVAALGLSEIPIAGTAAGFVIGFVGYYVFDSLFGDDIEGAVRGGMGGLDAPEDDIPEAYIWSQGVGIPDYSWLER